MSVTLEGFYHEKTKSLIE